MDMTVYENCTTLVWILISMFILFVFLIIRFVGAIERCKQGEDEIRRLHNEIKQTEAELQEIRNHLVHTEKMASLGELVAGIAHEINTPIGNSITTISHLEIKACECSEKLSMGKMKKTDLEAFLEHCQQVAKISLTNLERGAELIRSFKKIAVDQSLGEKRKFELREYMNDVLVSLNPQIKKKNHKVILKCPPGIKVWSYPGAVWQIISNLLNNSLLHAYEEEEEGTITIEIGHENGVITLQYADDGKGMTSEVRNKVFEPFFTTRRDAGGSGLGMHIVYNLVVFKMGGRIECNSQVGIGTVFTVEFPDAMESGEGQ